MTARFSVLACQVDVLTVEIEHVDVDALESAASQFNVDVEPTPQTLRLIQVQSCHQRPTDNTAHVHSLKTDVAFFAYLSHSI